jgi:cyclic pyranopterin phosphate synthase
MYLTVHQTEIQAIDSDHVQSTRNHSSFISNLSFIPSSTRSSHSQFSRSYHWRSFSTSSGLSHVNSSNQPSMVDVSNKIHTQRIATARSLVWLPSLFQSLFPPESKANDSTISLEISTPKGPVFATAIIAGTQAVKKTSDLIPFCHPLPVESIKFHIERLSHTPELSSSLPSDGVWLDVQCTVKVFGKTGVEMEALTGSSVAALTIYDMCKAKSHDIVVWRTELIRKEGGKSGVYTSSNKVV